MAADDTEPPPHFQSLEKIASEDFQLLEKTAPEISSDGKCTGTTASARVHPGYGAGGGLTRVGVRGRVAAKLRRRTMKPCRECRREISEQAVACPNCGAPYPARAKWDGHGFEYKSRLSVFGLPLIHVSFKYRANRTPVVARGVIAIGQFGCGLITIAQFGVGIISISQFTIAGFALAQFAIAYDLIAQMGVYFHEGHGQVVRSVTELIGMVSGH
jgi:hypothetical protein